MADYYVQQGGSRILNATRVDQSGADNADVIDWVKSNDFILAVNINSGGKDTVAAQYKLRWRALPAGSFVDVAATGVINYNADTSLVNGDPIAVGGRKCDSQGGDTWQNGEEVEGAVNSDSIDLADDYETEIHFGLDCSGAADGVEYEFELYDDTLEVTRGTCGATIKMETPIYYVVQGGSRILNATRVDQSGADNVGVTGWTKSNDFILAVNINSGGNDTAAAQYKLRWRNKTDAGSFVDVGAATEINYNATTDLVNGAAISVGGRKCDSQGSDTWQNGEEVEGVASSDSIDLPDEYETEIHFALDCSGATDDKEYEFELYDDTLEVTRGTCGATITMFVAAGWLSGWSYAKDISLAGQSGAGTLYQVDLDIGASAGGDFHLENHCTNFPQDIEVTDNDGTTLLDFWIEDLTADPIKLYVEVADDLGSNQSIWVYYGKSGATTNSDIGNTFLLGDDFKDGNYTSDPAWTVQSSSWNASNYKLELTTLDTYGIITTPSSSAYGVFEYKVKLDSTTINALAFIYIISPNTSADSGYRVTMRGDGLFRLDRINPGTLTLISSSWTADTSEHVIKVERGSDNIFKLYLDGVSKGTSSANSDYTTSSYWVSQCMSDATPSYLDDIRIRKYVSPEPAFSSAGAEQSAPAVGHPTMRRWGGIPGMRLTGRNSW